MLINWKKPQAGVLVIPVIDGRAVVKNLTLIPGWNEIDDVDWAGAKESCKENIAKGFLVEKVEVQEIELPSDKPGPKKKEKKESFPGINELEANEAREVVQETFNLDTLNGWLKAESRNEIRAVIHNQIETVNTPKPKKGVGK